MHSTLGPKGYTQLVNLNIYPYRVPDYIQDFSTPSLIVFLTRNTPYPTHLTLKRCSDYFPCEPRCKGTLLLKWRYLMWFKVYTLEFNNLNTYGNHSLRLYLQWKQWTLSHRIMTGEETLNCYIGAFQLLSRMGRLHLPGKNN